jgi:cysteine desulfurase / selenocysteine lyase
LNTVKNISIEKVREDFPILRQEVNGKPLIYFDNGATTQKPVQVIQAISDYYSQQNANIHRGVHKLSQQVTMAYEQARQKVARFIHAESADEIIFTRGTTESVNIVANALSANIRAGEVILLSEMEHHSNILPWQKVCRETGAIIKVIPVNDEGELIFEKFIELLNQHPVKFLSLVHVSNTLGTINPVKEYIREAQERNIPVMIDGAQAVLHMPVDVQELNADYYCFSGHKLFGPTGIGVLYAKKSLLEAMPNYQEGGGIIKSVSFEHTEYTEGPLRFEAGTPNIEGAIGLAAAIDYVNALGWDFIQSQEEQLHHHAQAILDSFPQLSIIGKAQHKAAVFSLHSASFHPFDLGTLLDKQGIAVRTGHHCTQPLMKRYGIPGTTRVSLAFYNTIEELDGFAKALHKSIHMLS